MKNDILIKIIKYGIYATAFVPLVILNDAISPFNFGKVIIFRSLIEILGAFYVILVLRDKTYLPKTNKIFWAFLGFVGVFTITTATSISPYTSFWGTLERMGGLWTFWHYFLFYIILTSVFRTKDDWLKFLKLTVFAGSLSALYGFGQKSGPDLLIGAGRDRIFGTIGNSASFAGYQLVIAFLAIILFFQSRASKIRMFFGVSFLLSLTALLMTAVRGAMLGLGVGLLIFAFFWFFNQRSAWARRTIIVLSILVILFVASAFAFKDSTLVQGSRYLKRITNLSLNAVTVQTRLWAWEAGLKGWAESPKTILFGWGPENFNIPFSNNFNPKFFVGLSSETFFDRAHNMFVEVLVTMGLIGFLAYVSLFLIVFGYLIKLTRDHSHSITASALIALVSAYVIHNLFFFDMAANFIVFFVVLGFISFLNRENDAGNYQKATLSVLKTLIIVVSLILAVAVPMLVFKANIKPYLANVAASEALAMGRSGDFDNAMIKFKEALSFDTAGKYEYRHQLAQYLVGEGGPSAREEKVREAYLYAINEVEKNIRENPANHFPRLYASRLNVGLGDNDKALEHLTRALEISPTFVRTYYELGEVYLNKRDYSNAVASYKKALDLNSDVSTSRWRLGLAVLASGDGENGMRHLYDAIDMPYDLAYYPKEAEYLALVDFNLKRNDFEKLSLLYERLAGVKDLDPTRKAAYGSSAAAAYAKINMLDEAEKWARISAEADPSFEPDARRFLESIGRQW